ncbi:hypothetical protein GCM10011371_30940 [Novosphingobium marinum]|uniref:SCP2 domain-containing protein n=1 Tax=Novosphingobium marinum TaxID=1514948 RepID=A0A7Z0BU96_9SPHN|nr:hypothetical protein [Novosphingobium marinum]NYH94953.1 hypothetical protein [Novosphingobium marinum]GGC41319.1 hypothetical protein GCM10011371_30940 [Novosphingobium marinum]
METVPYLSEDWFDILEKEARDATAASARRGEARNFTLLERYSDAPAMQLRDGPLPGFRIQFFETGEATVQRGIDPEDSADCVFAMDWPAACQVVTLQSGEALETLITDLCVSGRATIEGDLADCPVDLDAFHDAVVVRTRLP